MSGKRDDRPGYQALLAEARRLSGTGAPAVVVVAWLHRLGRRVRERVRAWEECKALGVEIHSALEGGVQSELVFNILASVAQEESRQIGERISATWRHLTGQGWHRSTLAPWGYRWRPATVEERAAGSPHSVLEPDPLAAPHVAETFERVAAGESTRAVADSLAGLSDADRGGFRVTRRTVQDSLRNPVYCGRQTRQRGEGGRGVRVDLDDRPVTRWQPIVSDETWLAVQDRLDTRRTSKARGNYLLAGILRCPRCGGRMHGESIPSGKGGSPSFRYRCGGDDRSACHVTANRAAIERAVLDEVSAVVEALAHEQRVQDALQRAWRSRQQAAAPDMTTRTRLLEGRIERARRRVGRATELLVDGAIDKAAYDDLVAKARRELDTAEEQLELFRTTQPLRSKLPPLEHVLKAAGGWSGILSGSNILAQRDVLHALVERIVPSREGRGVYRAEVIWTQLGRMLSDIALTPSR
jgi:DNA invertase Pin-like site-specific DNA recombinase